MNNDTLVPAILIPLAPIQHYIEHVGGLASLPGFGVPVEYEIEKPPYTRVRIDRTLAEARAYKAACNAIHQMRTAARRHHPGLVDLFAADAFLCNHLKVHPSLVYGPEWFDFEPEVEYETAPAVELRAAGAPSEPKVATPQCCITRNAKVTDAEAALRFALAEHGRREVSVPTPHNLLQGFRGRVAHLRDGLTEARKLADAHAATHATEVAAA